MAAFFCSFTSFRSHPSHLCSTATSVDNCNGFHSSTVASHRGPRHCSVVCTSKLAKCGDLAQPKSVPLGTISPEDSDRLLSHARAESVCLVSPNQTESPRDPQSVLHVSPKLREVQLLEPTCHDSPNPRELPEPICHVSPEQREPLEITCQVSPKERELPHGLDARLLPRHVAIIMDGNSRWAERRGLSRYAGHEAGVRALKEVVRLSCEWGIQALTVFAFSTENWHRPKVEVSFLMQLFQKVVRQELAGFVKDSIQVHIIGDIKRLPEPLQSLILEVEQKTAQNTGLKLTVAVGYSGRYEIVEACKRIAANVQQGNLKPEDITESHVDKELGTSWLEDTRNPDLLIRSSGEQRLSNFLLWQLAYTELFFMDACWPEVDETHYTNALLFYQRRNRRYGTRSNVSAHYTLVGD